VTFSLIRVRSLEGFALITLLYHLPLIPHSALEKPI
jgi:hypothetical protein